jgi:hypothetical protein
MSDELTLAPTPYTSDQHDTIKIYSSCIRHRRPTLCARGGESSPMMSDELLSEIVSTEQITNISSGHVQLQISNTNYKAMCTECFEMHCYTFCIAFLHDLPTTDRINTGLSGGYHSLNTRRHLFRMQCEEIDREQNTRTVVGR